MFVACASIISYYIILTDCPNQLCLQSSQAIPSVLHDNLQYFHPIVVLSRIHSVLSFFGPQAFIPTSHTVLHPSTYQAHPHTTSVPIVEPREKETFHSIPFAVGSGSSSRTSRVSLHMLLLPTPLVPEPDCETLTRTRHDVNPKHETGRNHHCNTGKAH